MEANQSSRKRKEPLHPLSGMLTRRKSQIYTHLNRSGQFRSDASFLTSDHNLRHPPNAETRVSRAPRRRLKSSNPIGGEDEGDVKKSDASVKDLRARRVFSKPLVVSKQELKNPVRSGISERNNCDVNPKLEFGGIECVQDESLSNGFGEELSCCRSVGEDVKAGMGVNCIVGFCDENPNLSRPIGMCSQNTDCDIKEFGQCGVGSGFPKFDDSACNGQRLDVSSPTLSNRDPIIDEENVQTTPPDPDIFAKQNDAKNRFNGGQNVLQAEDNCTGMPSTGIPRVACGVESNSCSSDMKIDSVPSRKLVLNPCARLKVFKAPSSVSYKRLLPFLLDIAKDKSCTLEAKSCPKIEMVQEENPNFHSQAPLALDIHASMFGSEEKAAKPILHTVSQEMVDDESIEQKFPFSMQAADSTNPVSSKLTSTDCSYDNRQPTSVTTDSRNEIPSPISFPQGSSSYVERVSSAKRLKVFKTPSSVSYRRLLPYLLDIAKDKSCPLEFKSCPKIEIASEEKPSVQSQFPPTHDSHSYMSDFEDNTLKPMLHAINQELSEDGSKEKFPSGMHALNSINQIPSDDTWPTGVNSDIRTGMPSPCNSLLGDSSHGDQVSSAATEEANRMLDNISPALVLGPPVSVTYSAKVLQQSSDGDHIINANTYDDAITVCQSTLPVIALPPAERSIVSPAKSAKGILKRNPSGCRGLCTCLTCASFRLHAERAFEFSKNQFQDTEEMVMELMKELSQLRTLLEMSIGDCNSQATTKINKVKEVCASSSKAEKVARSRLEEMKEDIFVHCRLKCLQRPRVNFAIMADEKDLKERRRSDK